MFRIATPPEHHVGLEKWLGLYCYQVVVLCLVDDQTFHSPFVAKDEHFCIETATSRVVRLIATPKIAIARESLCF